MKKNAWFAPIVVWLIGTACGSSTTSKSMDGALGGAGGSSDMRDAQSGLDRDVSAGAGSDADADALGGSSETGGLANPGDAKGSDAAGGGGPALDGNTSSGSGGIGGSVALGGSGGAGGSTGAGGQMMDGGANPDGGLTADAPLVPDLEAERDAAPVDAADADDSGESTGTCGDGTLNPGEQCDPNMTYGGPSCSNTCKLPSCGDGIYDPGEGCDDGNLDDGDGCDTTCRGTICGTKNRGPAALSTCVGSKLWPRNAQCFAYYEVYAKPACCTEPNASDPACPKAYPFSVSFPMPSQTNDLDWPEQAIAPLAMTSCRPVVATVEPSASVNSHFFDASALLSVSFAGLDGVSRQKVVIGPRDGARNPALIQVDRPLAAVTSSYSVNVCTTSTCTDTISSGTLAFNFAEYLPDTLVEPANPVDSPRVSGDQHRVFVAYREQVNGIGRVAIVGGQVDSGIGKFALAEPAYLSAFGPSYLSIDGHEASSIDLVHFKDDGNTPGNTQVTWVEDGTDLHLAIVDDEGQTLDSGIVHSGSALADVRIVSISPQSGGIAFVETVAGERRVRLLPVSAGGSVGDLVDISPSGANASEPTLSTLPEIAWVQDTAGDGEIWRQTFTQGTFTLTGTARLMTTGATVPRTPVLLGPASVVFADTVQDQARLYSAYASSSSPVVPQRVTNTPSEHPVAINTLIGSGVYLLGWREPGQQDAIRINRITGYINPALANPGSVSLGCANRGTDSLALTWLGNYSTLASANTPTTQPQIYGVWLEGNAIVGKQIPTTLLRTTSTCATGQLYCDNELELRQCDANGRTSTLVKRCDFPEYCDPTRVDCACRPGPTCRGNVAVTCLPYGTYGSDTQDCAVQGKICVDGACRATMYAENFESGIDKDWFSVGSVRFRVDALGANGSNHSLFFSSPKDQGYLYKYFETGIRPTRVSFYWRTPGPTAQSFDGPRIIVEGTNGSTELRLTGTQLYVNDPGTSASFSASTDTWYKVELTDFDWAGGGLSYKFSVDDSAPRTITMATPIGPELRLIRLVGGGKDCHWDEFVIE